MFALAPPRPIHSSAAARRRARGRLPWMVFDYIDGAAGEGHGERSNREALRALRLLPRILENVEHRRLDVPLLAERAGLPFGISPMGMCNLSGPGADRALARAAARHRIPLGVSTAASTALETMIETADGHAWFQLYFSGDEQASGALIDRAAAAGYGTLVLTVDVPEVGRRSRELERGFTMPFRVGPRQFTDFALHPRWSLSTLRHGAPALANFGGEHGEFDRTTSRAGADWSLLDRIRARWPGTLVVKGVLNVEDALRLRRAGVDAIQVSSHGGRQLDSAPPPIRALGDIRAAVGADYPLFYDSGIRSGEDMLKAYALGASFVFVGRPFLFAFAAGGERGLGEMIDVFSKECSIALAQLGLRDVESLSVGSLVGG